jgi:hypothetical protein
MTRPARLFLAAALSVLLLPVSPAAASTVTGAGYTASFGCFSASVALDGSEQLSSARLVFTDATSETLTVYPDLPQLAQGSGLEENAAKIVAAVEAVTASGRQIRATNPLDCTSATRFPYTVQRDGFTFRFDSCDTVTVSAPAGLLSLYVDGSKPRISTASAEVGSETPVGSLTASLEDPGSISWVVARDSADTYTVVLSPLRDCPPLATVFRYVAPTGPYITQLSTCYAARIALSDTVVRRATVEFSDGTSVTETYDPPLSGELMVPAPPNTYPVRVVFDSDALWETGTVFTADRVVEMFRVCASVDGGDIAVVDDTLDGVGVVAVLDNDRAAPGAKLRPESLTIAEARGMIAEVENGAIRVLEITAGESARLVYQVCDTFNRCGTATLTVSSVPAAPVTDTDTEDTPADAGGATLSQSVQVGGLLLVLVVPALILLVLRRRRVQVTTGDDAEVAGDQRD